MSGDNKTRLDVPLQEHSNDTDPTAPYVWDDDSDDSTLAVMAAGMDPDSHMPDPDGDLRRDLGETMFPTPPLTQCEIRTKELEDRREQAILQVLLTAQGVSSNAGEVAHQEISHYLVDKEFIDRLREAISAYTDANEAYIANVDGIDATPSTPEM